MEFHHFGELAAGIVAPPLFALLIAGAAGRIRSRRFVRFKTAPAVLPDFVPTIPEVARTAAESRFDKAMYEIIQPEHNRAKFLQDQAFYYLVLASASLLCAFLIAAAAVTLCVESDAMHVFSAATDMSALAIVGWAFHRSANVRAAWLSQRCFVELIRQWVAVEALIHIIPDGVTARFETFKVRVLSMLSEGGQELHASVSAFAAQRIDEIEAAIADNMALSMQAVHRYLLGRPIRQVRWFESSRNRISHQHEGRRIAMLGLFAMALLEALAKVIGILALGTHGAHDLVIVATFMLLVSIGIATALTSTFVGQGLRSMRHRYAMQLAAFKHWFAQSGWIGRIASENNRLNELERSEIAVSIAQFERLMLIELLDWITIAGDDAMEIGPI